MNNCVFLVPPKKRNMVTLKNLPNGINKNIENIIK
jgi:hypothetical protein